MTRPPFDPDPLDVTDDYQRGYVAGWDDGHDCTASHEHGPTALLYLLLVSLLVAGIVTGFVAAQVAAAPRPAAQGEATLTAGPSASPTTTGPGLQTGAPSSPVAAPVELVTQTGILAWADESFGPDYLAVPPGPGLRTEVCGPGGCVTLVSTDAGPNRAMLAQGRIGDLAVRLWERVCGVPRSVGLCQATWTVVP